jgi:hypothetical protein
MAAGMSRRGQGSHSQQEQGFHDSQTTPGNREFKPSLRASR